MFIDKNSIMLKYVENSADYQPNPKEMGLYQLTNNEFVPTTDTTFQSGKSYYISMGQYLVEAKYGYHKLWGEDTGRNLAGDYTGTLLGIFPKITMQFRKLTKSEIELLVTTLDNPEQYLTYYDPKKRYRVTLKTYTGDYEILNKYFVSDKDGEENEGFSCAFISTEKRT